MLRRFGRALVAVVLASLLAMPASAYAIPEESEDQSDLSASEIASAIAGGQVDLSGEGLAESGDVSTYAAGNKPVATLGGATRYDTSAQEALAAFSQSQYVILAGGTNYSDSIAGSGLAGALDAPILLVDPQSMGDETTGAIRTLKASKIVILGGESSVSKQVESQATSLVGSGNVVRLSGATRYDTQMKIYEYGVANSLWSGGVAVVASGANFPDALSVSPVAFSQKAPVFFVDGSARLPSAQSAALKKLGKRTYLVIGGTSSVSSAVESTLRSIAGTQGSGTVTRLGGADRYETSQKINDYAVANLGFTWENLAFASGQQPYDALGGGAMQGKNKRVLSLFDFFDARSEPNVRVSSKPAHLTFIGGRNTYSNVAKLQVAYKLGFKLNDIQGMRVYIDAGHGWNSSNNGSWDSGAVGNGYKEADLTSELADKVAYVLRNNYGLDVYVNKSGWYKLRQTQAAQLDCGALVSIHFNSGGGAGSESYVHDRNMPWGSTVLQHSITPGLANAVWRGNRGEKQAQLAVLSTYVPSTLLEICFIDNSGDMQAYVSKKDTVAAAIADGIALS